MGRIEEAIADLEKSLVLGFAGCDDYPFEADARMCLELAYRSKM
jgi:hypothetical protein